MKGDVSGVGVVVVIVVTVMGEKAKVVIDICGGVVVVWWCVTCQHFDQGVRCVWVVVVVGW